MAKLLSEDLIAKIVNLLARYAPCKKVILGIWKRKKKKCSILLRQTSKKCLPLLYTCKGIKYICTASPKQKKRIDSDDYYNTVTNKSFYELTYGTLEQP